MTKITQSGAPASRGASIVRHAALVMACFAAVTCDLVTAPKAGSGTQFSFKLNSADTLVVGTPVPINIDVTQAGTALQGARLEIVSSNPNVIAVVDNSDFSHALNPVARGTAILTVRLLGSAFGDVPPSDTFAITAVAHAITATRGSVTMKSLNDTLTFGAKVFDGNNVELVTDESAVRWTSNSPNVVRIDPVSGKATALANGTAILKAAIDVDTALDTVTVAQQVAHYTFSPSPVLITALGATAQITTTPKDSGGSTVTTAGLPAITYLSRRTSSIAVNGSGLVTGNLNDSAFVLATATVGGSTVTDSVKVEVGQVASSIFINQSGPINKDALNDTVLISASAFDAKNVAINTRSINFSSGSPLVARLTTSTTTSTVLALDRTGSAKVFAQMDGAKDSITINVSNVARTLFVTPDTLRFTTVDDTIPLSIQVRNSRGDTVPQAGSGIAWQSLDTTIATVDTAGRVWAHAVGTGRVRATIPTGVPDTSVIKVQNLATSVDLVPAAVTLASIGDTVTIPTNIRNARNKQLGAASVQWSTTNQAVATVGTGFVTAQAAGTTFILAVDSLNTAHRDSVLVTVTNAPATVALDHHLDTLHALTTKRQFTATVRNARGVATAQQTVTWSSSNTAVISVDAAGNVTAQGVGTAFVRADTTFGGTLFRDSAAVVVQNDIDHIVVAQFPLASIASLLDTTTLQASAVNVLGGLVTGVAFQWTSSDSTIASVNHTTGLVTALSVGSVNITATVPSAPSVAGVTTRVDISNLPTFVDITPTSITLASINDTVLPAVTLKNKLGALLPRTAAQWISDNPAVAFVTHDTVIAASRGVTYVRARNSISTQIQDSVLVTVTNAPVTVTVQPHLDSLPSLGRTKQLAVSMTNARGAPILNEPVTWGTLNASIAQVSSTGLISSIGIGNTKVFATDVFNGLTDTAIVRVSNFAATVSLNPAGAALAAVSATQLLTSTPRNEAGGVISGATTTWSSSNPSVVAFLPTGTGSPQSGPLALISDTMRVVAIAAGTASITATVDGVPTSITVTVGNAPTTIQITSPDTTLASIGDVYQSRITIQNALGATLPNTAVNWSTGDQSIATVSSTGVVTAVGAGGPVTIQATSPANASLFSTYHVTVSNAPASLTISPVGPTTLTSIGQTLALTATVKNAAGAVIASPSPAVTWSSNSGAVSVNAGTGVATASSVGGATITATAGTATNNTTVNVTLAASTVKSTIGASASSITANGAATSTITVQLKDASGTNLTASGGTVTMTLTGTGSLGTVTNHNDGTYTATLTAPTALGSGSVSAALNGTAITSGDPQVQYVAGAAAKYIVGSSSSAPVAGTQVTITAQQADAFNNPVTTARTVTWSSTGGGNFTSPTSPTNGSGVATVTFTTSTTAGTNQTVTATDNVAIAGTSGIIQTIAGNATTYLVTPSSTSPSAGSDVTVTAQLRDANSNNVSLPNQTVNWTKSDPGGSFTSLTSSTNAGGTATITLHTAATAGTATTVTATTGGVTGTSVTITTTAGAASTATSTITPTSSTITAGGNTTITVQLKDAGGTSLGTSGGTVTLTASPGGPLTVTDNANGTYTATLSSNTTGLITVSGTLNGAAITATANVTVNVGNASAAQTTASVPTGSAGSVTTISVQAKDAFGNNRTTTSGTIAATVTGANNATGGVTDNGNGTYTVTYTPTVAGSDAIAMTLNGTPIGGSPYTSVVTAGTLSAFTVEQTGGGAIGSQTAGTGFNIRVTAKDAFGNTVTSFTGTADITSTSTMTAGSGQTPAFTSGVLSSRAVTLTTAGNETITATNHGGGPSGASNSFAVAPGAASAAQSTGVVPAGNAGQVTTISVQAKDAFGNNRTSSSGTLTVSITSGPNTGAATTVTNNGDGTYTATYTPATASVTPDQVTVKLGGTNISGSPFSSLVSAGGLDHFAVTATGGGSIGTQTAGSSFNVKITAQDASNNTVSTFTGATAKVTITSTGTLTGSPVTSGAFTNGVLASQALTITSAGSGITIGVTDGTHVGTSNGFTVNAGALAGFVVEAVGGGALPTQATGVSFNIQITAVDANGNTVTSFSGSGGGGHKAVLTSNATMTGAPITTGNFTSGVFGSQAVTITSAATAATITATRSGGTENGTSASFQVIGPASAATSTVTVSSSTDSSGVPITVTLHAKDAAGNALSTGGATIGFQATGGTSTGNFSVVTDNNDGTYTATFTGAVSGTATTIKGTVSSTPTTSSQSVTVIPGAPSAATSTISVTSNSVASGSQITVTLHGKDAAGNTITTGGATNIGFVASGGSSTGTFGGTVTDNGDGTYSNTFTGVLAGSATTINGTVGGVNTTSSQAVTVTFGSLDHFDWSLTSPQTTAVAFTGTNTLTAKDAAGNTITNFDASANNVTVTLTATGTVSGLGSGANNVLDQAADFVNGVADLAGKLTYTRSAAETSATFIATSAVGGKTGTSAPVSIGP